MKYIEDPKLLNLRFTNGMLLLPYYHFRIMNHLNNPHVNDVQDNGGGKKLFQKFRGLIKGIFHIRLCRKKIIGISNANFEHIYRGEWKNILHGYYYDLYPKDFMMIETWDSSYGWKSHNNYSCFSTIIIYLIALSDFIAYSLNLFKTKCDKDFEYISSIYLTPFQQ